MSVEFDDNFVLVRGHITEEVRQNVLTAAVYLVGRIKANLGSGQRTGKEYKVPGTNRTYTSSAPGEAPAVMLANLITSITHQLTVDTEEEVVVQVGTIMEYAARLEFGFNDVDSLGRRYQTAARPYFRTTYIQERERIRAILGGAVPYDS
jgi:hypothetical protein